MATGTAKASTTSERISDEALKKKTSKDWQEWFADLDKEGAIKLTHKEIVAMVQKQLTLTSWWGQMIAVGYEQERGLRAPHEKPSGFEISVSKTIKVPVGTAFLLFQDVKLRRRWLKDPTYEVRKATENKSLRITWPDGTSVVVDFYPKSANKTQVVVQHQKIASAKAAEKSKGFWAEQLERLKSTFEE
jgi:Activator of Hsp90 ATPase homolog 1-like protein